MYMKLEKWGGSNKIELEELIDQFNKIELEDIRFYTCIKFWERKKKLNKDKREEKEEDETKRDLISVK